MILTYCDVCEKNIIPTELTGMLMYFERNWVSAIKIGKEKSIEKRELLFCEACLDDIKTYITKNQKQQKDVDKSVIDKK